MRKRDFCLCENKGADQLTAKLISAFVFRYRIAQLLFFLNPKFQVSSHLLCLHRPVCVGPGGKPRRPVFSRRGSYHALFFFSHYSRSIYHLTMLATPHLIKSKGNIVNVSSVNGMRSVSFLYMFEILIS